MEGHGFRVQPERADAVALAEFVAPGDQSRVLLHVVKPPRPRRVVVQQEREDFQAQLARPLVFHLRDAERLARRHAAAAEGDQQDTQIAALDPLLRKLLRLAAVGRPVLHRVDLQPGVPQLLDHQRPVLVQVQVSRRDKRTQSLRLGGMRHGREYLRGLGRQGFGSWNSSSGIHGLGLIVLSSEFCPIQLDGQPAESWGQNERRTRRHSTESEAG